jgi:hypothetical protein
MSTCSLEIVHFAFDILQKHNKLSKRENITKPSSIIRREEGKKVDMLDRALINNASIPYYLRANDSF